MNYPETEIRVIQLHGAVLRYRLVRRRRRSVGFKVDPDGLTVAAPLREPYRHLEALLVQSADWIRAKLAEQQARRLPPRRWVSGEALPLLGDALHLYVYRTYTRTEPIRSSGRVLVGVPDVRDADAVRDRVANWYRCLARQHFAARIAHLAPRLGAAPPAFKLSEAKTTWGLCTPEGELRLSWRLIKAPQEQIDYVVAHELAHLRHMDHSRAFWDTVASICPDYRQQRQALERDGHHYHTF